jgi:hypothetical protein
MLCEEAGLVEKRSDAKLQVMAAPLSLNFFMADIQAGIGPFFGVFLTAHGWASIGDQILGNVSSAGARRHRRGLAKRRGPGPRGAHSEWHERVNVGQGAVMTVQGVGAALSPAIGGWLALDLGYPAAFVILGCFAIGSIVTWLLFASALKPACAGKRTGDSAAVPVPAS